MQTFRDALLICIQNKFKKVSKASKKALKHGLDLKYSVMLWPNLQLDVVSAVFIIFKMGKQV